MGNEKYSNDQVNVADLISKLWIKKSFLLRWVLIFFCFGVLIAILRQNEYLASSKFVPQQSSDNPSSSLGGLAAIAGINLSSLGSDNEIPPSLYPSILSSTPYKLEILESEIILKDTVVTYAEYLKNKKPSILSKISQYTVGLPSEVIKMIKGKPKNSVGPNDYGSAIIGISFEDYELLKSLDNILKVEINEEDGFVLISAIDNHPEVSAQIVKNAENILQNYVIDYKIKQSKVLLEFTEQQFLETQKQLYVLQDSLALLKDKNQNLNSAYSQNQIVRVQSNVDMVNEVYKNIAMQKSKAELQVQKNTPTFSIISPVTIPNEKNTPNRPLIVILFSVLGMIFSVGWVLLTDVFKELSVPLNNSKK